MDEIKIEAQAEAAELKQELLDAGADPKRIKLLKNVINNVAFMKAELDRTIEDIGESSVAIPYDNGGGQAGIRENPVFKGYESLWKSYLQGIEKITAIIPQASESDLIDDDEKPKTVLELVRDKHKAV